MVTGIRATGSDAHRTRARGQCFKMNISSTTIDFGKGDRMDLERYTAALSAFRRTQNVCTRMHMAEVYDVGESAESEVVVAASCWLLLSE